MCISFFYKINFKNKKILDLGDYIDIYAINFIFFSLSSKYIFTYNLKSSVSLLRRLGLKTFFLNCRPNFLIKNDKIKICYNKKIKLNNNEINFNFDYFKPFDDNDFHDVKFKQSIVLPYYVRANFYKKNLFQLNEKFRKNTKKFSIIFSGSDHSEWYEQFQWQSNQKSESKILTRTEILNFVKNEFKEELQIINDRNKINNINIDKKILFLISDPSKKRKHSKILNIQEHLNFIASSKFFLTCPGTAMPLSHHLIESMFLGTVPITSYGNLLFPSLDNSNSLAFSSFEDLHKCIKKALTITNEDYFKMRINTLDYYSRYLSPRSFLNTFMKYKFPLNIYMNIDGHTLDERRERFGLTRLFPLPKSQ